MLGAGRLTAPCHWQRCLCQHLQRSEREGRDAVRGAPLSAVREVCSAERDDRRPSGFRVRKPSGFRVRKRIVAGAATQLKPLSSGMNWAKLAISGITIV